MRDQAMTPEARAQEIAAAWHTVEPRGGDHIDQCWGCSAEREIAAALHAAIAAEREACARIADDSAAIFVPGTGGECLMGDHQWHGGHMAKCHQWVAAAIRAPRQAEARA